MALVWNYVIFLFFITKPRFGVKFPLTSKRGLMVKREHNNGLTSSSISTIVAIFMYAQLNCYKFSCIMTFFKFKASKSHNQIIQTQDQIVRYKMAVKMIKFLLFIKVLKPTYQVLITWIFVELGSQTNLLWKSKFTV